MEKLLLKTLLYRFFLEGIALDAFELFHALRLTTLYISHNVLFFVVVNLFCFFFSFCLIISPLVSLSVVSGTVSSKTTCYSTQCWQASSSLGCSEWTWPPLTAPIWFTEFQGLVKWIWSLYLLHVYVQNLKCRWICTVELFFCKV